MHIYFITNPHDPYTLLAPDLATAACATIMLGEGAYGLHDEDGNDAMPIFLFGGQELWCEQQFGCSLGDLLIRVGWTAIATCLDTVLLGSVRDRQVYEKALAACRADALPTFQQIYADLYKPSSTHDLRAYAQQLAARVRQIGKDAV